MQFSILVREKIEIPAQKVAELVAQLRSKWELAADAPVSVEDILIAARNQGVVFVPSQFNVDTDEELEVTQDELVEAIEEETNE